MPNSILPFRFNLDYSGEHVENRIMGEEHTLIARKYRPIAPMSGAFFVDNLEVWDASSNTKLARDRDFITLGHITVASAIANKEVASIILIINPEVSNRIYLNLNYLGERYERSAQALIAIMNQVSGEGKPVSFADIVDRPTTFEPAPHFASLTGSIGFEYLIYELERIRQAILLGDVVDHDHLATFVQESIERSKAAILEQNSNLYQVALTRASESLGLSEQNLAAVRTQNDFINQKLNEMRPLKAAVDKTQADLAVDEARARDLLLAYPAMGEASGLSHYSTSPSGLAYSNLNYPLAQATGVVSEAVACIDAQGVLHHGYLSGVRLLVCRLQFIKELNTGRATIKLVLSNIAGSTTALHDTVLTVLPFQFGIDRQPKEVTVFESDYLYSGENEGTLRYIKSSEGSTPLHAMVGDAVPKGVAAQNIAQSLLECRRDFNILGGTESPHREAVHFALPTEGELQLTFKLSGTSLQQVAGMISSCIAIKGEIRSTQGDVVRAFVSPLVITLAGSFS